MREATRMAPSTAAADLKALFVPSLWQSGRVPLSPELQALFDAVRAKYPQGVSLDELAAFLIDKPVTYADIEAMIDAFAEIGEDLTATEPDRPEDLVRVLAAARAITTETGHRPSIAELVARTSLSFPSVLRALQLGRSLGAS
jgi:hypothetical protein